ncbi:B-cell lymphoma 6 protein-like [Anabrus simplex]|uniref:B-cell lymphoma 6 protein-like n=1 Tax=Anabrus simplex TaxID=316456 RepID=UPI0035A39F73
MTNVSEHYTQNIESADDNSDDNTLFFIFVAGTYSSHQRHPSYVEEHHKTILLLQFTFQEYEAQSDVCSSCTLKALWDLHDLNNMEECLDIKDEPICFPEQPESQDAGAYTSTPGNVKMEPESISLPVPKTEGEESISIKEEYETSFVRDAEEDNVLCVMETTTSMELSSFANIPSYNFSDIVPKTFEKIVKEPADKDNIQREVSCPLCNKILTNEISLKVHLKYMHIQSRVKIFSCDRCEETFSDRGEYKSHWSKHREKELYVCNICSRAFSRESYLENHVQMHTFERPYICKECNRTFNKSETLWKHLKTSCNKN